MTTMRTFSDGLEGGLSSARRGDWGCPYANREGTLMVGNLLDGGDVFYRDAR